MNLVSKYSLRKILEDWILVGDFSAGFITALTGFVLLNDIVNGSTLSTPDRILGYMLLSVGVVSAIYNKMYKKK